MKYVHLELAQESRRGLIEADLGHIGSVIYINNTQTCECSALADCTELLHLSPLRRSPLLHVFPSRLMRLSCESFLDLEGPRLKILSDLCLAAHRSEEFFHIANATDQWLRTVIGHENLPPTTWTKLGIRTWTNFFGAATWSKVIPGIIIHSNVLPYDPYWSRLQTTRDGANTRVHFPSCILEEALEEGKTLKTKLLEWKGTGKECEIGQHVLGSRCKDGINCGQPSLTSKLFREIQAAEVEFVRELADGSDGIILLITWRGGMFVQKQHKAAQANFDAELEVVKRLCHPHIVYSFGRLRDGKQSSYFMEYMSQDLLCFINDIIRDRTRRRVGDNKPPFSHHDSVDILSQVAKAMRHMHQATVNVIHCDLKSLNILISGIVMSDDVTHYLVKVADFGSARFGNSSSGSAGFKPGDGTTQYSAPEVLKKRANDAFGISFPHKVDVYSFGIVAFEVLTGKNITALYMRSPSKFKKGVIEGTWRPPLREECEKHMAFIQDKELISLIEKCWHHDPSERPSFESICEELDKVRVRIPEQVLQSNHLPAPGNSQPC